MFYSEATKEVLKDVAEITEMDYYADDTFSEVEILRKACDDLIDEINEQRQKHEYFKEHCYDHYVHESRAQEI